MQSRPIVALLELYQEGHHQMYLGAYVASLVHAGFNVIVLTPNAQSLTPIFREYGIDAAHLRECITLESIPPATCIRTLVTSRVMPSLGRWHYAQLVRRHLRRAEARLGLRASSLYCACLYEHHANILRSITRAIQLPWSALYLFADTFLSPQNVREKHQRNTRKLIQDSRLQGVFTLDEGNREKLALALQKPVFAVPDITQTCVAPDSEFPGIKQNRDAPLIGLLGYLRPTKGLFTLAQVILHPESKGWDFLIAGEIPWHDYKSEECELIRRALQEPHVTVRAERIASEARYNKLFSQCRLIFAAYHDFPHSSNTLTKAAYFKIPILVTANTLMAARVNEFQLGECVAQADPLDAIRGINAILQRPATSAKWSEFNALHTLDRLKSALLESGFFAH